MIAYSGLYGVCTVQCTASLASQVTSHRSYVTSHMSNVTSHTSQVPGAGAAHPWRSELLYDVEGGVDGHCGSSVPSAPGPSCC